jgi:hydrophobic/amphiphilic exporter-1 (mainly G- bacteria), HAE1 family
LNDKLKRTAQVLTEGRRNISRWSIEHPYTVIAFYLGVAILAVLVIFFQMPRRMMPYVESPMVGIVSMMPGLSAEEMEIYFSKPSRSAWWT